MILTTVPTPLFLYYTVVSVVSWSISLPYFIAYGICVLVSRRKVAKTAMNIEAFLSAKDRITYARFNPIEKAKEYLAILYKSGDLLDYVADAYI